MPSQRRIIVSLVQRLRHTAAFSLLEVLVSMVIAGVMLSSAAVFFLDSSRQTQDQEIITLTNERAHSIIDFLAFEIRMAGAGMPLSQTDFEPGQPGLDDAPLPILTSSNRSRLNLRLSTQGQTYTLTETFTPGPGNSTFTVDTTLGLVPGALIYLSNMPLNGISALAGTVAKYSSDQIALNSKYFSSTGAQFPPGSVAHRVDQITYESSGSPEQLVRGANGEFLLLAPRTTVTFHYLNRSGQEMSLPLTAAAIWNNLGAIRVSAVVESDRRLRSGSRHQATAAQSVSLRNLLLK